MLAKNILLLLFFSAFVSSVLSAYIVVLLRCTDDHQKFGFVSLTLAVLKIFILFLHLCSHLLKFALDLEAICVCMRTSVDIRKMSQCMRELVIVDVLACVHACVFEYIKRVYDSFELDWIVRSRTLTRTHSHTTCVRNRESKLEWVSV